MSKETALAFDAISGIKDLKATLLHSELKFNQIALVDILNSINIAHEAIKSSGIQRIVSIVHIDVKNKILIRRLTLS